MALGVKTCILGDPDLSNAMTVTQAMRMFVATIVLPISAVMGLLADIVLAAVSRNAMMAISMIQMPAVSIAK
jgi:hypothetical protein